MPWRWYNLFVCPVCGEEVAESGRITEKDKTKSLFSCLHKKCSWKGLEPGELHGRIYE